MRSVGKSGFLSLLAIAIICCFCCFSLVSVALAQVDPSQSGAAPAPGSQGAAPLVLHGSLEHSERLAPVEPQLQAGVVFTAQSIPQLQANNDWYWIPSWYAGQKHVDSETILRDYSFKTGRTITPNRTVVNRQDLAIGFQPDRNGQVWEFKRAPYTTTVEAGNFFTTMLVRSRDPVSVTQNMVVIKMVQTANSENSARRTNQYLCADGPGCDEYEDFNPFIRRGWFTDC